ncbi:ComC/BlpC family peptide pheromone/bacteriocin [Streptococcus suis]|uniref:ComC/BlpC family peptide pheromone/bacteriocin n=1 Tax=Streptococcus suis TaxID=1307 RepID=UPI001583EF97|nr:ComC/BlpC family peptide pheromone/bacteriocin [Streptococcus suis]MBY4956358.1 ComC/BlpC family peptide pheromone/bacteriocin [Streptococcus suis]MBY5017462.1 ComC/BlpC family peptide pheromone/bacteriocin [Streptococcus suis]MDG4508515.1 ComC/BlpC family peptide pheromone/bacteriocin [Streptococcus suis]
MNTNFTNRFDVMPADMLLDIEGGKVDWKRVGQCALSIGIGASEAYMATAGGTMFLGPYAIGTGAVGAVIGGIGGAFTC